MHAAGEVDISTIALLEEPWVAALARRPASLTLDLSDVTFIDSTGLQFLLRAAAMGGDGTRLQFRSCSPAVRRAIEICGIERHLPLAD